MSIPQRIFKQRTAASLSKRPILRPICGKASIIDNSQGDQPEESRLSKSQKSFRSTILSKKSGASSKGSEENSENLEVTTVLANSNQPPISSIRDIQPNPECIPDQDLGDYDREVLIDKSRDLECIIGERNPICSPRCPRCSQRVFYGEKRPVDGQNYHQYCYKCGNPRCRRPLDARQLNVHKDDIYCKFCYIKYFGPEGFGNANGIDGQLTINGFPYSIDCPEWNTIPAIPKAYIYPRRFQPEPPQNLRVLVASAYPEKCFRCGSRIDPADKYLGANKAWHRSCFICFMCRTRLTPSDYCINKDGQICCKYCLVEPCDDPGCALKIEDSEIYTHFKSTINA